VRVKPDYIASKKNMEGVQRKGNPKRVEKGIERALENDNVVLNLIM
jgi:hypothetical protein